MQLKVTLFALAAVIWVGGANLLAYLHARRRGIRARLFAAPFPVRDFSRDEWIAFLALFVSAFTLGFAALRL